MASTPTPSLRVEIPGSGDYRGTWDVVMARILNQLDAAIAGATTINTTGGTEDLDDTQYEDNDTRASTLVVTGALADDAVLVVPARSKLYRIINKTTGAFNVYIKASDGDPFLCPAQGSAGEVRIASDKSIVMLGPYVNCTTGEITSSRYAFLSELAAEVARASGVEDTLVKLDGSRDFTGVVKGKTPTANDHLATKQYVDGVAGISESSFITTGSASTYIVTTGLNLTLTDGLTISFRPHATNEEAPKLNLDGTGAKFLRGFTGKTLRAGVAIQGTPYRARYISATQEWLFLGYFDSPYSIPLGGFLDYVKAEAPNSYFAMPFGQAVSRVTYVDLYNLIGVTFGEGNGSTTFNLPDLRGRTVVGLDDMGGNAANRVTTAGSGINGSSIGAVGGDEKMKILQSDLPDVSPTFTGNAVPNHAHNFNFPIAPDYEGGSSDPVDGTGNRKTSRTSTTDPAGGHTPSGTISSINGGVTQTNTKNMQPSIVLPKLLRVI